MRQRRPTPTPRLPPLLVAPPTAVARRRDIGLPGPGEEPARAPPGGPGRNPVVPRQPCHPDI